MQDRIDFTDCKRIAGKAYNGANGKKIAVEYNGEEYMIKFPASSKSKPAGPSYTNSCISEHIASSIFNMLGINTHKTLLGVFSVSGKEKVVCACKDFTADGKRFLDFCSIKNSVIDTETSSSGTETELDDILEIIEKQGFVNPQNLKEHFWDMFVADAFAGNFDRHNGNWGLLYNPNTKTTEIAPVYDCGSCLLSRADEKTMQKIIGVEEERNTRLYNFPTSAIKYNGEKIKYYDFMMSGGNKDLNEAVKRIVPRIDIEKINDFIDDVPYISELQKEFYKTYIGARYEKILLPVLAQVQDINQEEAPELSM